MTQNGYYNDYRDNFERLLMDEPTNLVRCPHCQALFLHAAEVRNHIYKAHRRLYQCEYCPAIFEASHTYEDHKFQVHGQAAQTTANETEPQARPIKQGRRQGQKRRHRQRFYQTPIQLCKDEQAHAQEIITPEIAMPYQAIGAKL